MNWKTWLPLIIAVVLGLIAAKVGRDILVSRKDSGVDSRLVKLVVARKDIAPGHTLVATDLMTAAYAPESLPRSGFRKEEELVGRVASAPMIQGQPIVEAFLAPVGSGSGAQAIVPAGMRAVTIEVNEFSGVAGLLVPGCRVDVVSTLADQETRSQVARTIVQNVKVLAVGQRLTVNNSARKDEAAMSAEAAVARSVTLLVMPRQAEAIELASSSGRTRLVLRGQFDEGMRQGGDGVSVAELLGTQRQPIVQPTIIEKPTTQPVSNPTIVEVQPTQVDVHTRKHMVEFIRGTKLTRGEFEVQVDAHGHEVVAPTKEIEN